MNRETARMNRETAPSGEWERRDIIGEADEATTKRKDSEDMKRDAARTKRDEAKREDKARMKRG
jgi:hypothetical protein